MQGWGGHLHSKQPREGALALLTNQQQRRFLGSHDVPRVLFKGSSVCLHLCVCLSVSPLSHIAQIHDFRRIDSSFRSSSSPKVVLSCLSPSQFPEKLVLGMKEAEVMAVPLQPAAVSTAKCPVSSARESWLCKRGEMGEKGRDSVEQKEFN